MHFMVQKLILRVKESNNGMNEINLFFFLYMIWLISIMVNQLDISISYHCILRCILLSLRISIHVKLSTQKWNNFFSLIIWYHHKSNFGCLSYVLSFFPFSFMFTPFWLSCCCWKRREFSSYHFISLNSVQEP